MKTVKSFVNKEHSTTFVCPYCEKTYCISVSQHKGSTHKLVTKCSCQNKFEVELNFRQSYRKGVELVGEIINVSTGSSDWFGVTVVNLSMTGLRFAIIGPKDIEMGHKLRVRFSLHDRKVTLIQKEVRVVDIQDDHYGCEFLNPAYEEKELGYYLFSD